ncbi:hypothetical protein Glove_130g183 [Diversispora epigaea]|uniref:Uncharacterized protein n=1 Tax=Diversispora epigaea TaxID=1348612 RepID=A0A397J0Q8_9GLOM|nr:hypothetical protein Glove_130g183 [Diversispora epigaea]
MDKKKSNSLTFKSELTSLNEHQVSDKNFQKDVKQKVEEKIKQLIDVMNRLNNSILGLSVESDLSDEGSSFSFFIRTLLYESKNFTKFKGKLEKSEFTNFLRMNDEKNNKGGRREILSIDKIEFMKMFKSDIIQLLLISISNLMIVKEKKREERDEGDRRDALYLTHTHKSYNGAVEFLLNELYKNNILSFFTTSQNQESVILVCNKMKQFGIDSNSGVVNFGMCDHITYTLASYGNPVIAFGKIY